VSDTFTVINSGSVAVTEIVIYPSIVNLKAFPIKFIIICFTLFGSDIIKSGTPYEYLGNNLIFFFVANT
jgi:hypothetical protein